MILKLMKLDPYKVLGVPHDASYEMVKKVYKKMLQKTHPDKMGDASFFILVHKAFYEIREQLKKQYSNVPKHRVAYSCDTDVVKPTKMKHYTQEKFNRFFDEHKIIGVDPYATDGYRSYMCERLNHQEDISEAAKKHVYIPNTKIVRYKEPEVLPSSAQTESLYHFGVDSVTDFSGAGGTDIMKAFSHKHGHPIDTVKRYNSVDQLLSERSSQNLQQTEKELRRQKKKEAKLRQLEQYRLQCMRESDSKVTDEYIMLHNRLT